MTEPASRQTRPGSGGKSAAAFRTISEVASQLDLPQHVLRFWETKFPQIKPLKRGGGRRYYRPEDVDLLRRIQALLYDDGYTIRGVQKILRQNGARSGNGNGADRTVGTAAPMDDTVDIRAELKAVLGELKELRSLLPKSEN